MNQMINIKLIIEGTNEITLAGKIGESLMDVLNSQPDMNYTFPCGGSGRCGKCVIRVLEGFFDVTAEDEKFFDDNQLSQGYRLACKAVLKEDCVVEYKGTIEKKYDVQSTFVEVEDLTITDEIAVGMLNTSFKYGIAIDIGTTTIAISLVELSTKKVVFTHTQLNHQRKFGADVIARIHASNEGKADELRSSIEKDLCEGIIIVLDKTNIRADDIEEIVIAGNTTMQHILLGYSCETLGVFPFTPVDISAKTILFSEVFKGWRDYFDTNSNTDRMVLEGIENIKVYIIPGISTYVGADISAGILHSKMTKTKDISLLIDLGTNGEMAIGNCEKLLVTSTAAGPAFEGGNISCGTGSIDGAICDVAIEDEEIKEIVTINDAPLAGICGTGVIAITAELLENELVDETGRFEEDYFDDGFELGKTNDGSIISFTQKDIREIQLAKSAVRAGVETLILRYGIEKDEIAHVYLAGGFGFHIDLSKSVKIGLLPEEFLGRIIAVGNSSLGGAVHVLSDDSNKKLINDICSMAEEISLSDDRDFQEFYMDYMMFEED